MGGANEENAHAGTNTEEHQRSFESVERRMGGADAENAHAGTNTEEHQRSFESHERRMGGANEADAEERKRDWLRIGRRRK